MIQARIPEAMTMRQKGVPRESSDVADLLRLPRIVTPITIIRTPRVTKPELGESRGQLVAV